MKRERKGKRENEKRAKGKIRRGENKKGAKGTGRIEGRKRDKKKKKQMKSKAGIDVQYMQNKTGKTGG